mgnify:FL=1
MTDIQTIDMSIGVLIIAVAVLYAAWYEYRKKNQQDAKLLLATGLFSLSGSAFMMLAM